MLLLDEINGTRGPFRGLRTLSLDKIGSTPGRARFFLVQICHHRRPLAADKLMLSPNTLLG